MILIENINGNILLNTEFITDTKIVKEFLYSNDVYELIIGYKFTYWVKFSNEWIEVSEETYREIGGKLEWVDLF